MTALHGLFRADGIPGIQTTIGIQRAHTIQRQGIFTSGMVQGFTARTLGDAIPAILSTRNTMLVLIAIAIATGGGRTPRRTMLGGDGRADAGPGGIATRGLHNAGTRGDNHIIATRRIVRRTAIARWITLPTIHRARDAIFVAQTHPIATGGALHPTDHRVGDTECVPEKFATEVIDLTHTGLDVFLVTTRGGLSLATGALQLTVPTICGATLARLLIGAQAITTGHNAGTIHGDAHAPAFQASIIISADVQVIAGKLVEDIVATRNRVAAVVSAAIAVITKC